jgi:hypothetical protein
MRTKVLLCAAALAASIACSWAQNVYSLNVVGYYNITVAANQKVIIANQLNTTNNTIGALLAPPMVGNNDNLFKYAAGFTASTYSTDDGSWSDPSVTLNPGEAAFFQPAGARTLTFVGEVLQGSLTNTLPLGVKVLRSSMVPQQGQIDTDLGVVPDNNDNLFTFSGGYTAFTYSTDDGSWNAAPIINVGQGFFYVKAPTGAAANVNWVRNFTVQ